MLSCVWKPACAWHCAIFYIYACKKLLTQFPLTIIFFHCHFRTFFDCIDSESSAWATMKFTSFRPTSRTLRTSWSSTCHETVSFIFGCTLILTLNDDVMRRNWFESRSVQHRNDPSRKSSNIRLTSCWKKNFDWRTKAIRHRVSWCAREMMKSARNRNQNELLETQLTQLKLRVSSVIRWVERKSRFNKLKTLWKLAAISSSGLRLLWCFDCRRVICIYRTLHRALLSLKASSRCAPSAMCTFRWYLFKWGKVIARLFKQKSEKLKAKERMKMRKGNMKANLARRLRKMFYFW